MMELTFAGQQTIEKAFELLDDLLVDMDGLDSQIADRTSQVIELDKRITAVTSSEKRMEADLMQTIAEETDANGKKAFSNAETRKAELERRMGDNASRAELATLVNERISAEQTVKDAERRLKALARREHFLHARIDFGTSVLNIFKR